MHPPCLPPHIVQSVTARFLMDLDLPLLQPPKGRTRWILIHLLLPFEKIPQDSRRPGRSVTALQISAIFLFFCSSSARAGTDRAGLSADGAGGLFLTELPHRLP